MRVFVKARAYLLQAGYPSDHPLVAGLRAIRNRYRIQVGAKTYLSQMLGKQATALVKRCVLGWEDGGIEDDFGQEANRQVQRYLRRYTGDELPYVVEIHEGDGKVSVKYL